MTKKTRDRAVKMKTEYTCQKKGTNTWLEPQKKKRCFIAKKVDKNHNLQLFTQAVCFANMKSPQRLPAQGQHCL